MKRFFHGVVGILAVAVLCGTLFSPPTSAVTCSGKGATPNNPLCMAESGSNKVGGSNASNSVSLPTRIHNIINLLIYAIGMIAVIMIVIGGIRYTTSAGDQSKMGGAKNTIMYAIIGLVVAVMAYVIVGFVINQLSPATAPAPCKTSSCKISG